jgi:hypothetical protein
MINPCAQPPMSGLKPVTGPSPELAVSRALQVPAPQFGRRVLAATRSPAGHRVTYPPSIPDGRPVPARHPYVQLSRATAEPAHDPLLVLADPDPPGLRRISLTSAGYARREQLRGASQRAGLPAPDPQFPTPKTPAGRRSSCPAPLPAPGGQPDPRHPGRSTGSAGADVHVLDPDLGRGRQQRQTAPHSAHASQPIHPPGAHLHPQLRHPPLAGPCREGGNST